MRDAVLVAPPLGFRGSSCVGFDILSADVALQLEPGQLEKWFGLPGSERCNNGGKAVLSKPCLTWFQC